MMELIPLASAGFIAGLIGSTHCLGMCGGLSGMFAMHASVSGIARQLPMALVYNLGRVLSYSILGLIVAMLGKQLVDLIPALAGPVRLAAGLIMILVGLQIAFQWRFLGPIENTGAKLWNLVSPLARRLLPVSSLPRALGLGLLWGLLPCGLVYSVLLIAATSGEAAYGALTMLAFGAGTTPAMLATGLGAARLSQWTRQRRTRLWLGLLVVLIGVITLSMPVLHFLPASGGHAHH